MKSQKRCLATHSLSGCLFRGFILQPHCISNMMGSPLLQRAEVWSPHDSCTPHKVYYYCFDQTFYSPAYFDWPALSTDT